MRARRGLVQAWWQMHREGVDVTSGLASTWCATSHEGRPLAVAAAAGSELALKAMRSHELASGTVNIGQVIDDHRRVFVAKTGIEGTRVVDLPLAEQLPRMS